MAPHVRSQRCSDDRTLLPTYRTWPNELWKNATTVLHPLPTTVVFRKPVSARSATIPAASPSPAFRVSFDCIIQHLDPPSSRSQDMRHFNFSANSSTKSRLTKAAYCWKVYNEFRILIADGKRCFSRLSILHSCRGTFLYSSPSTRTRIIKNPTS
jgi:hypothetical protein